MVKLGTWRHYMCYKKNNDKIMPNSNALQEKEIQMTNKVVYAKSHEKGFRWKGEDPVKNNSIDILD